MYNQNTINNFNSLHVHVIFLALVCIYSDYVQLQYEHYILHWGIDT